MTVNPTAQCQIAFTAILLLHVYCPTSFGTGDIEIGGVHSLSLVCALKSTIVCALKVQLSPDFSKKLYPKFSQVFSCLEIEIMWKLHCTFLVGYIYFWKKFETKYDRSDM